MTIQIEIPAGAIVRKLRRRDLQSIARQSVARHNLVPPPRTFDRAFDPVAYAAALEILG